MLHISPVSDPAVPAVSHQQSETRLFLLVVQVEVHFLLLIVVGVVVVIVLVVVVVVVIVVCSVLGRFLHPPLCWAGGAMSEPLLHTISLAPPSSPLFSVPFFSCSDSSPSSS